MQNPAPAIMKFLPLSPVPGPRRLVPAAAAGQARDVVVKLRSWEGGNYFARPFYGYGLLKFGVYRHAVRPHYWHAHACCGAQYIRYAHYLARLVKHLHLFLRIAVIEEYVNMGNNIERNLVGIH